MKQPNKSLLQLDSNIPTLNECNESSIRQEQFVQAFRKPTLIYRCLQHRQNVTINQRNLSYMSNRLSRNNRSQKQFTLVQLRKAEEPDDKVPKYFNLIFDSHFKNGFSGTTQLQEPYYAVVEAKLCKITKNKDLTLECTPLVTKSCPFKYDSTFSSEECRVLTFCTSLLTIAEHHSSIHKLVCNLRLATLTENGNRVLPTITEKLAKVYGFEIIVNDKATGLISEGDYTASLSSADTNVIKSFSPKKYTWEHFPKRSLPLTAANDFKLSKKIKFHITWSDTEIPEKFSTIDYTKYTAPFIPHADAAAAAAATSDTSNSIEKYETFYRLPKQSPEQIVVEFIFRYSNNTRQVTEFVQEPTCPWCRLKCLRLYSLIKHLKLCHSRFNFTYQGGTRIEITINNCYDGTYYGSPYDLAGSSSHSSLQSFGPTQRTSATIIFLWRSRRQRSSLDEFIDLDDDDGSNQRPYINGHCRLYHHTETCLPIFPSELEYDSESEIDPDWLRKKTVQMIDDFSDVNEGEKEVMKIWNLHLMRHGFVGDHQLPMACTKFLIEKGNFIITSNLYRNFLAHLSAMVDYGVISPEHVHQYYLLLQNHIGQSQQKKDLVSDQIRKQTEYWLKNGVQAQKEYIPNSLTDSIEGQKLAKAAKLKIQSIKRVSANSPQKATKPNSGEYKKNTLNNDKALNSRHQSTIEPQSKRMRLNYAGYHSLGRIEVLPAIESRAMKQKASLTASREILASSRKVESVGRATKKFD